MPVASQELLFVFGLKWGVMGAALAPAIGAAGLELLPPGSLRSCAGQAYMRHRKALGRFQT